MYDYNAPNSTGNHKRTPNKRRWIVLALICLVAIVLVATLPMLTFLLSVIGFVVAVIGVVFGKFPGLRLHGRKQSAVLAGIMGFIFVSSAAVGGTSAAKDEVASPAVAEPLATISESPAPSAKLISDFIGENCDGDELVMEQGTEKLYCDVSDTGVLAWFSKADHDKAVLASEKEAEEKAAAEKAAAEKKIAAKEAAEKKEAELAEQKKAEEQAAAAAKEAEQKRAEEKKKAARLAEETVKDVQQAPAPINTYYQNCSAVRAAGAAPIHRGDPGYSSKLDRDGDGVGCES